MEIAWPLLGQKRDPLQQAIIDGKMSQVDDLVSRGASLDDVKDGWSGRVLARYLGRDKDGKFPSIHFEGERLDRASYEKVFGVQWLDSLLFSNFNILERVKKRTDRVLQKRDSRQVNLWMRAMYKKEVEQRIIPPLDIRWIDPFFGRGVFAMHDIAELTFIGEYTGFVRKRSRVLDKMNDYVFGYVTALKDTPFVIDASKKGNFVRFINHSDEPNLTSRWVVVDGVSHIILFANRFIEKGEQLTYSYGPYYWRKRPAPL